MRSNQGYSKYNTYKNRDEFSRSFLKRLKRFNEMNVESDEYFGNDCLDYGSFTVDNYEY